MVTAETLEWASRNRLQFIQRAKHKKAFVVERRHEILRSAFYKWQPQLVAEGIDNTFPTCLLVRYTARMPCSHLEKAHQT